MHMHASGPACHTIYGPDGLYSWAADMDTRQWRPLARHPHQLEAYRFRRQLYYATCAILVSIPSSYSEGVRYPSPF